MNKRRKVYAYCIEFSDASFIAEFGEQAWVYHLAHNLWGVRNEETGNYFHFQGSPLSYAGCKKVVGTAYYPEDGEVN